MGLGIISGLKSLAPFILYGAFCVMVFAAMTGKSEWILMFLAWLLPLRNVVQKLQQFPLGKDLIDVLLFFAVIGVIVRAVTKKDGEKGPGLTAIHWLAIALMGYTCVSVLLGSYHLGSPLMFSIGDPRVQSWKNFCIMPIMFFLTFATFKDKKTVWKMFAVMCASMVLMDYYTAQQVTWYHGIESRVKINGTFVYLGPNEIAAFYNTMTIILMGIFFHMKAGPKKIAIVALIVVNFYIIIFLFSRAAYAGFAMGLFFLFSFKKQVLLIPLILAAIAWQTVLPQQVVERIEMTTGDYNQLDKSSEIRIELWKEGLDLFASNPIFGVGYGVFRRSGFMLKDTHNIYVKLLAEQGIIGILLFLALLFSFFITGVHLYRNANDELSKGLGLGFAIAVTVMAANNFFGDRWTYVEVGSYMWITAALVARLLIIESENRDVITTDEGKTRKKTLNDEFPVKK